MLGYPDIKSIVWGDTIEMMCGGEPCRVRILDIRTYPDFEAMLKAELAEKIAPGITSEDILTGLQRIYTRNQVRRYGVVVLQLQRVR